MRIPHILIFAFLFGAPVHVITRALRRENSVITQSRSHWVCFFFFFFFSGKNQGRMLHTTTGAGYELAAKKLNC